MRLEGIEPSSFPEFQVVANQRRKVRFRPFWSVGRCKFVVRNTAFFWKFSGLLLIRIQESHRDASRQMKWKVKDEVSPKLPVQGELNLNLAP
jgi:hypothetical protein